MVNSSAPHRAVITGFSLIKLGIVAAGYHALTSFPQEVSLTNTFRSVILVPMFEPFHCNLIVTHEFLIEVWDA